MINIENITYNANTNRRLFRLVLDSINKRKERKIKEPKGKAEEGSYCPKKKAGQSWAHIKDTKEDKDDREDVA